MNHASACGDITMPDAPSGPVELTEFELSAVAGGLNPQPEPPGISFIRLGSVFPSGEASNIGGAPVMRDNAAVGAVGAGAQAHFVPQSLASAG